MKKFHLICVVGAVAAFLIGNRVWATPVFDLRSTNAAADPCKASDIHSIPRPYYPDASGVLQKFFQYKFRVTGNPASAQTVIVIPGGPGQTSIDGGSAFIPKEIAVKYRFIYTDPRGRGCNTVSDEFDPAIFYNTSAIVSDLISIVRAEKLTQYYLYGMSYGTAIATRIGTEVGKEGLPLPAAIILEGTVGRAFQPNESNADALKIWSMLFNDLSQDAQTALRNNHLPFNLTHSDWGNWITSKMALGSVTPDGKNFVVPVLNTMLASDATSGTLEAIKTWFGVNPAPKYPDDYPKELLMLHRYISCREFDQLQPDVYLDSGDLKIDRSVTVSPHCRELTLTAPFDSAAHLNYQPVFYFAGGMDPNTPKWQAEYHREHQPHADRHFVFLPAGGHGALSLNLADCGAKVWDSIIQERAIRQELLNTCDQKAKYSFSVGE